MAASSARNALRWKYGRILDRLPEHYKRHRMELEKPSSPVHYREEPGIAGHWKKDPETGERQRVENVPIPLIFPKEADAGIWGGEGIIKGFQKRKPRAQKVSHYWIPVLKKAVVYSEILDKYMAVTVTERTLQLIHKHFGFDNYILETPVQDLKSQLALDLRRKMLLTLVRREMYKDDQTKQQQIYEKYKKFIIPEEEIEWFGLSLSEAVKKLKLQEAATNKPVPLKTVYREELIKWLKEEEEKNEDQQVESTSSWFSRLNPFARR